MINGIKNIVFDCDGVLTDASKWIGPEGRREAIRFNSRDDVAMEQLREMGYKIWVCTASSWEGIPAYFDRKGVEVVMMKEKREFYHLARIKGMNTLAVGDCTMDLPILLPAKYAFCPSDAHPFLRKGGKIKVLETPGGAGVAAEILTKIFTNQIEDDTNYRANLNGSHYLPEFY